MNHPATRPMHIKEDTTYHIRNGERVATFPSKSKKLASLADDIPPLKPDDLLESVNRPKEEKEALVKKLDDIFSAHSTLN